MALLYNVFAKTGTADTLASGSVVGGNAIQLGDGQRRKVSALAALVTVLAETNTFTWGVKFQVSKDNSTWVDLANGTQNAAAVVLATGTAGADTAVTKSFALPEGAYGWAWCRIALVTGGTTGAAADTYTLSYCLRTA